MLTRVNSTSQINMEEQDLIVSEKNEHSCYPYLQLKKVSHLKQVRFASCDTIEIPVSL